MGMKGGKLVHVMSKWYVRGDSDIRGGGEPEGIMSDSRVICEFVYFWLYMSVSRVSGQYLMDGRFAGLGLWLLEGVCP